MKLTKLLIAASTFCVALLVLLSMTANVGAQDNPTPTAFIIITATPVGTPADNSAGAASTANAAPASASDTSNANGTPVPREIQALRAARVVLQKKLNKNLSYVKAWTWSLELFKDNNLGCAPTGTSPAAGDNAGYRITMQPLGDANIYELRVTFDLAKVFDCGIAGTAAQGVALPAGAGNNGTVSNGAFELGGQIQAFGAGTVVALHSAKMKWIKVQIAPGDGSGPGSIAAAQSQGFKILLSVKGDRSQVLTPGYFDTYASFVGSLAAAGADGIEIWNEMNIDREWPTGQINPATYTQMLQKAYTAIKAAHASTLVITGALAPTGAAGGSGKSDAIWNDDVYYAGMATAGAGKFADCIGAHYNEGIVSPDQASGDPRGDNYPTRYFSTMLARASSPFGGQQVCFTELGYLTPEGYTPLPAGFTWAQGTTVAQQAQWLARAAVLSSQNHVRLMIVFNVDFSYYGADPQAGYAIIRPGAAGCPACAALAAAMP